MALLLAVAKSALSKLASFHDDLAIEHILIFFPSSETPLRKMEKSLTAICAVLRDAGIKQVDNFAIRIWLDKINDVIYDVDDLLDEVATDVRQKRVNKGSFLPQLEKTVSPSNFQFCRQIGDLCQKLEVLLGKIDELGLEGCAAEDEYHHYGYKSKKSDVVFGREEDKLEIIKCLSAASDVNHCSVFTIWGVGGIGKTTLAEMVYYDHWFCARFDLKLWVSTEGHFNKRNIMECIVNTIYEDSSWDLSLERLEQRVFDAIHDKKYFLVLDEVWYVDEHVLVELTDMLKTGRRGSVILLTTQSRVVVPISATVASYELRRLSEDVSWSMFSQLVFEGTEREKYPNLVKIGRSIIQKCAGIPLLVKLLAGMLGSIRDEKDWWRIADTLKPSVSELIRKAYIMLPSHLRACFGYSFMFLEDTEIYSSNLINCWRAQGLLQEISSQEMGELGDKCFNELLMRLFLQDSTFLFNNCAGHVKMHKFVHNCLRAYIGQEKAVVNDSKATKHLVCRVKDEFLFPYVYPKVLSLAKTLRTLKFDGKIRHISRSLLERIISRFTKLRVLDVSNCNVTELPNSIGELKHLRLLNLSGNHAIKSLPSTICKLFNLQTLNLDGCKQLEKLPGGIQKLSSLSYFSITSQQSSLASMELDKLSSLQHLELFSCCGLTSLWADGKHLTSLRKLLIFNCQRLVSFHRSMNYLIHLEELVIHNCPNLDLMETKGFYELKGLRSLEIVGIQKLVEFPSELSSATALQHLLISDCRNLRSLWRPMPNLTSLQTLCIYDCPNLLMLPQVLCSLAALQSLDIRQCPCLSRNFSRNKGFGWSLISCIPEVIVNGRWLQFQQGRKSTQASSSKICTQYLPRSLSYFSSKLTTMQVRYTEGRRMEEYRLLGPILQSRWEVLSLAFRAIVRMRIMIKEKHKSKLSNDRSLGQTSALQKSSRWRLLSLVQGAIVRMRTMAREKHRSRLSALSNAQLEMMLHCCLFDNNYEFERLKLVQLWIAAKFLQNEPLEDDGQRFFDFLVEKNYIFLSRVDIFTRVRIYKVNLEQLNATFSLMPRITNFQMRLEDGNLTANRFADSWHISVPSVKIDQTTFEIFKRYRDLRTLIFLNNTFIERVPSEIFSGLKLLTALDLSGSCITELPSSVGDVKELCYIDVSRTPIKKLPQSIVCLQKLQTLRLKGCMNLFGLPKGIKELVNLRHLDFDILRQLSFMPRGIGTLIHLRTLSAFVVDDEEGCNIRELEHMDNLSGKLCISGLECVVNSEDAKEADLTKKEHLKQLELRWSDIVQLHENEEQCSGVLKCLKPSFGLEELQIICFPGLLLPSWISDPQYINLISITLFKCENCSILPSFGQLLKLKNLYIIEMNSVKKIDDKFCEVNVYHEAFPMLETLAIDGMMKLELWMGLIYGECPRLVKLSMKRCPQLTAVDSFPCLRSFKHLEVTHCPSLESLPVDMLSSPLETIVISACPKLERRYSKGGEDSSKIRHVPNVWIDLEDTQSSDEDDAHDDDSVGGNFSLKEIHSSDEEAGNSSDDISITDGSSTNATFSVISHQ